MYLSHRLIAGALASAALVAAGPLTASAAAHKRGSARFSEHCVGKLTGTNSSSGTCTSKFGHSHYKVTLTPPTEKQVDTYANGKIYSSGTVQIRNGKAGGSFKFTGGTGHFKGAKGSGSYTVTNTGGHVVTDISGTISF